MSNIFSSVEFHDSAFHRSDWEGLLANKESIWIAGVCGDGMGMRRAVQIKGPRQESRRRSCPSISRLSLSCLVRLTARAEILDAEAQRAGSSRFMFIAIFESLSLDRQKKKFCSTISLINLLPASLRKTRPASSFPARLAQIAVRLAIQQAAGNLTFI